MYILLKEVKPGKDLLMKIFKLRLKILYYIFERWWLKPTIAQGYSLEYCILVKQAYDFNIFRMKRELIELKRNFYFKYH